MKQGVVSYIAVGLLFFSFNALNAALTFSDLSSKITFEGSASLKVTSTGLSPITGTLEKNPGTTWTGAEIPFDGGVITDGDYEIKFTGTYDPSSTYSYLLNGGTASKAASFFVIDPGFIAERILVSGSNNRLEGFPRFEPALPVKLSAATTVLRVAVQNELNKGIELSGGKVILDNNLAFGDSVQFADEGTIDFNGFNLVLGQKDLIWTTTLMLMGAKNFVLNADNRLTGEWIFDGDAQIIGNNNVIDFSGGGRIRVKAGTELRMTNVALRGLGSGSLQFDDKTARVELFDVAIEMDDDVTFTIGGFKAVGPVRVITGDFFLTYDPASCLTVDGTTMVYDNLDFNDNNNIRFTNELNSKILLRGGSIRKEESLELGDLEVAAADKKLDREFQVTPLRKLIVEETSTINGDGFKYDFAVGSTQSIVRVVSGKDAVFINIELRNFPINDLTLETGSSITFSDKAVLNLGENSTLTTTLNFAGKSTLNGGGKILCLGTGSEICVRPNSALLIDNVEIQDASANKIRCFDSTATVSFGNVKFKQDGVFSFTVGSLAVVGRTDLIGTTTFAYCSPRQSHICHFGTLCVDRNMAFSYDPCVANRDLIALDDSTATLELNNASLGSSQTGMRLTKGTVFVRGNNTIYNAGAVSLSQAISLGNGTPAEDVTVEFAGDGVLEILSGKLVYNNAV
ncbi:MAG: hypothetical protein H6679_03845 [Epsilonproteobacteria bacterium]|nr:hypothetical protein [Campylobacterota bacterium]